MVNLASLGAAGTTTGRHMTPWVVVDADVVTRWRAVPATCMTSSPPELGV